MLPQITTRFFSLGVVHPHHGVYIAGRGTGGLSLYRRLDRLHIRYFPPLYAGPNAIEKYEAQIELLMKASMSADRVMRRYFPEQPIESLEERLGIQVTTMRVKANRILTVTEAASMLRVRKSVVIAWIRDLEVLKADERGGIHLQELRRFMSDERRWLLPVVKITPSGGRPRTTKKSDGPRRTSPPMTSPIKEISVPLTEAQIRDRREMLAQQERKIRLRRSKIGQECSSPSHRSKASDTKVIKSSTNR